MAGAAMLGGFVLLVIAVGLIVVERKHPGRVKEWADRLARKDKPQ